MARIWHKPGVLMTAYMVLYVVPVFWVAAAHPALLSGQRIPDFGSPLIAAFLAWRVAVGGSLSRGLIIVYKGVVIEKLVSSADMKSGGLVSLGLLAICLVQIALLVSRPIYDRTRKDWAGPPASTVRLWPAPRWWMAAGAVAGGLVVTLLFLGSEGFQSVRCTPPPSASPARCLALAQGFPVHWLSAIPDGNSAFPVIDKGAAAEDLAVWTVLSFAACYLIWLPGRRPAEAAAAPIAAPA